MLRRSNISRRPSKRKRYAVSGLAYEWAQEHESCAACWATWRTRGSWLEVHHLLGGRYCRPDAYWNFLRLCNSCHERLQGGRENLATCLLLKSESDPDNYDRAAMQEWMKRFGRELLPDVPAALPEWIREARGYP